MMPHIHVTKPSRIYHGASLTHAVRGGGPVLEIDASWRTVNGVLVATRRGSVWFEFRHCGFHW